MSKKTKKSIEEIKDKISQYKENGTKEIKEIDYYSINSVIVLVNLLDTRAYKIENSNSPEKWILRQMHFLEIVSDYIAKTNGMAIKYNGDEVMGVYEGPSMVDNSVDFISRITEIEETLTSVMERNTKIKIAIDSGKIFYVQFPAHAPIDPQGIPVERCLQISKHLEPSTILTTSDFANNSPEKLDWYEVGLVDLTGTGKTSIYQYATKTISIDE